MLSMSASSSSHRTCHVSGVGFDGACNRFGGSMSGIRTWLGSNGAQWECEGSELRRRAGAHVVTGVSDTLYPYERGLRHVLFDRHSYMYHDTSTVRYLFQDPRDLK